MKKILIIIFTVVIFAIGSIFGYKKILSIEKENKIIQLFNKDSLENFSKNKNEMLEKLKTLNKEEADELYEQYLESNNTILENLNIEHDKLLSGGIYNNEDTSENFTDEEWKIANKFLNKYDLELWYLARGTCIIKEVPDFYYKTFKDYVTDDYKEYLKITSKENEEHYVADSGLCITLEELGDRIVTWENFLEKYPNSKLNDKVNNICNSYRRDYILGVPGGIYDYKESAEEYNRFIKKYPDSPTTELLGYYLEEVNLDKPEDNDSEALSKMIDEYIEKYFYLGSLENRKKGNLFSEQTNTLLKEFNKNKEEVINKLKTLNKEEADKFYEDYYNYLTVKYPDKFKVYLGYNPHLANELYAGSDLFLMPSRYEPCGLSQMIAMRFGTIPIVRETGGLKDTVKPYNIFTDEGNGFSFTNFNADDMLFTIKVAEGVYYDKPEIWEKLVKRNMDLDFSWDKSAREYLKLYELVKSW